MHPSLKRSDDARPLLALLAPLAILLAAPACSPHTEENTPDSAAAQDSTVDGGSADHKLACTTTDPRSPALTVAVLPDEGETPLLAVIAQATSHLRVLIYAMGTGGVIDALEKKAQGGVSVKVILDPKGGGNSTAYTSLKAAGVQVLWSDPGFPYMHAKVLVADDTVAAISTGNFDRSDINSERNYVATTKDAKDVSDLVALFDADWARKSPVLTCTRLIVSPVNAEIRILSLINGAKTSLLVESMELSNSDVRTAILARKTAGADVRVLLASPSWVSDNTQYAAILSAASIPVRYLKKPAVHAKAVVVDGARAYLGSENLSRTSLTANREVGLVATDAAVVSKVSATIEKDWAAATAF
jgi:cardiolipin synthase A/B